MKSLTEIESALRRLTTESAADRFLAALRQAEHKYRLDQARWPKGTPANGKIAGGRYSPEGGASRSIEGLAARTAANISIRGALANPALATSAVVGAGVAAGSTQLAVTMGSSWYGRTAGGGATPFLGQPLTLMEGTGAGRPSAARDRVWGQCQSDWLRDRADCDDYAISRITPAKRPEFWAECYGNASQRLADCMSNGGRTSTLPLVPYRWRKK